ncbi:nuclease-related domain-containing protein [Neobacillus massiliamazoniensis]|uniref:NERD domain-containing protein n=1 Tax=Neobacillus massiliamazoniensis TaxID=1499688 RepID=A0A0U1P4P0_9BACI|nr:nuclease-related domain-containing protein [Neobacillus massiliamazoniensis]CRK85148.1 NERD domain-containing protein [Neobacillus massiliamazoniensis]
MPYKPRVEKDELKLMRFLNTRMDLLEKDKKHFLNLQKGYEGEGMFDLLTEKLSLERYVLNDLLLEFNNSKFQIDTTMIVQEKIYLFEVKNFESEYEYRSGILHTIAGNEVNNPLDQIKRSESLFRQLLQKLGLKYPVESWVIFINPEFTLYQAPKNQPFKLPTQLNQFMKKLNATPSKLNGWHKKLADQLVSLHQIDSPYPRLPPYEYGQLRNGFTCATCHSFSVSLQEKELVCGHCGHHEKLESAVLRSVEELKLLFPNRKITTNAVHEWCGVGLSKKGIKRFLDKNYKSFGHNRWIYYE